ncbi:MAG: NAD-dependent epimerase/dehydratase family protein [Pirellulales bacterium]
MKILLTGACGFAGSALARAIADAGLGWTLFGIDNLGRAGSELNRSLMGRLGVKLFHGDLRCQSDVDALPAVDWIVDCAANPSVLAGADGQTSSRQLMEHNLLGTVHLLELCKATKAGLILLSTSRVYSIEPLAYLPVEVSDRAFRLSDHGLLPGGVSAEGIAESFSTQPPLSLYGASKLASETLALEYGATFDFPVWLNRCGVLAGAGQFGRPDQGIFAYWINCHCRRVPLRYIGFDGQGHQVRDCLHPRDLVPLLEKQIAAGLDRSKPRLVNIAGGRTSAMSLRQLTDWCDARFGPHSVGSDPRPRAFDLPWVVLDSRQAWEHWNWVPQTGTEAILNEIAAHAQANPDWLRISSAAYER